MRQAIAQKLSDAFLNWRDAETLALYEFPFGVTTKGNDGERKKPETKTFEEMLGEVAAEQCQKKLEDDHLGIRIGLPVLKRTQDIDNCIKAINDGLKQVAFGDDGVFDYCELVRVRAELQTDVCITVEILKQMPKREPWI